jgi:hypothetical protein
MRDNGFKGQGICDDLLLVAKSWAERNGYDSLQAGTRLDNSPAMRLFGEHGFIGRSLYQNRDGAWVMSMTKDLTHPNLALDHRKGWEQKISDPVGKREWLETCLKAGECAVWNPVFKALTLYSSEAVNEATIKVSPHVANPQGYQYRTEGTAPES